MFKANKTLFSNTSPGGTATTPVLFPNGTAAACGAAFANDPDAGMWLTAAGTLNIQAGASGSNVMNFICGGTTILQMNNNQVANFSGGCLIRWDGRTIMSSPSNGNLIMQNGAQNDFGLLIFGAATSSYPALKRNAAALEAKVADDSAYTQFNALQLAIVDGVTAPTATAGLAKIFVDTADGDLKIIFGDGTTKTIVVDT